jgi:nickel transport protein
MKSLIRWGKSLGLVGGILIGSLVVSSLQALGLTTEQVVARLRSVPVFMLANNEGKPLVAVPAQGSQQQNPTPNVFVFMNQQDAQTSLNTLKSRDPQTAQGIQVMPVSLARIYEYEVNQQSQQKKEDQVRFTFIPDRQQVEAAKTLLQQSGQNPEQFEGVPLFVAKSADQNGGYLVIGQGDQQSIQMYFDRAGIQALLDRLRQVQPDLASKVTVQVINLESVLETLHNSDNQELNRIVLVPPQSSIDFIRSLQQGSGQGNRGGTTQQQARPNRSPQQAQPGQASQLQPQSSPQPAQPQPNRR